MGRVNPLPPALTHRCAAAARRRALSASVLPLVHGGGGGAAEASARHTCCSHARRRIGSTRTSVLAAAMGLHGGADGPRGAGHGRAIAGGGGGPRSLPAALGPPDPDVLWARWEFGVFPRLVAGRGLPSRALGITWACPDLNRKPLLCFR